MEDKRLVEDVDYMVDYYAILGIPRFSDEVTIKKAYREMMNKNHPDKVQTLSKEIQTLSLRKTRLAERASNKLLSGEETRKEYDALFEKFDDDHISKSGYEVLVIGSKGPLKIHIGDMIEEQNGFGDPKKMMLSSISGFDPGTFRLIEKMYLAIEKPDEELEEEYHKLLEKKIVHDNIMNEYLWRDAGIENIPEQNERMVSPEEIIEQQNEFMEKIPDMVKSETNKLLLDNNQTEFKLLEADKTPTSLATQKDRDRAQEYIVKMAMKNFNAHKEKLKESAETMAENLSKLQKLTKWEYIGERIYSKNLLIIIATENEFFCIATFIAKDNNLTLKHVDGLSEGDIKVALAKIDELMQFMPEKSDVALLEIITGIEVTLQLGYLLDRHLEGLKNEKI